MYSERSEVRGTPNGSEGAYVSTLRYGRKVYVYRAKSEISLNVTFLLGFKGLRTYLRTLRKTFDFY